MTHDTRHDPLRRLTAEMVDTYRRLDGINRLGEKNLPDQLTIASILVDLRALMFPGYFGPPVAADSDLEELVADRLAAVGRRLSEAIRRTLEFCHQNDCVCEELWLDGGGEEVGPGRFEAAANRITDEYLARLPKIREELALDVAAAYEGDPAASNVEEVILCYPGVLAITVHRLAHPLHRAGVPLLPRIMSEWAHRHSGVDIHPGADIGPFFFIDHGTGVVIGETTSIGARVKIYQGVTLGALSFRRNPDGSLVKGGKRHPDIGDDVTIYAGATILGGETVIGAGAVVGGGTWITESVGAGERVTLE
jgi:serine O-acetyltransferase